MTVLLFNMYSENLMEETFNNFKGIVIVKYNVKTVRYAGDIAFAAMNEEIC